MRIVRSAELSTAAARLRVDLFTESEAIITKARAAGRLLTLVETKKLRELTKAIRDLMVTVTPEERREKTIIIRPKDLFKEG